MVTIKAVERLPGSHADIGKYLMLEVRRDVRRRDVSVTIVVLQLSLADKSRKFPASQLSNKPISEVWSAMRVCRRRAAVVGDRSVCQYDAFMGDLCA
jgi:hypothetical protein